MLIPRGVKILWIDMLGEGIAVVKTKSHLTSLMNKNEFNDDIKKVIYDGWENDHGDFIELYNGGEMVDALIVWKDGKVGTIAHEIMHYIDKLCAMKGIDDFEIRGYMMGHLIEQAMEGKYSK